VVTVLHPAPERLGIVVSQLGSLFLGEVCLFCGMEMFFHLFDDMLGLVVILDFEVRRRLDHLVSMAALRAEFPPLEMIHVRELPASRTPDDTVHGNEVMRVVVLKNYRMPPTVGAGVFPGKFYRRPGIPDPPFIQGAAAPHEQSEIPISSLLLN
jgi:hypothetical protein